MAPRLPSKIPAKVAEPSTDAIYNAYPDQGPGFYRYVDRDSRSRSIAANLKRRKHAPLLRGARKRHSL